MKNIQKHLYTNVPNRFFKKDNKSSKIKDKNKPVKNNNNSNDNINKSEHYNLNDVN